MRRASGGHVGGLDAQVAVTIHSARTSAPTASVSTMATLSALILKSTSV